MCECVQFKCSSMKKQTDSKKGPNQNESLDNCPLKFRKECEIPSNVLFSSSKLAKELQMKMI